MFKRLFLISALCISLVALLAHETKAWPLPSLPSGYPLVSNTDLTIIQQVYKVHCDTLDTGEEVCVVLEYLMLPTKISFSWCNPDGECDTKRGIPFHLQGPVSGSYSPDPSSVDEQAKYITVTESYTPEELYEFIKDYLPKCDDPIYGAPNCNWYIDPSSIIFEQLGLRVEAWAVSRDNTRLELADFTEGCFTRPPTGGFYDVVWDSLCE